MNTAMASIGFKTKTAYIEEAEVEAMALYLKALLCQPY